MNNSNFKRNASGGKNRKEAKKDIQQKQSRLIVRNLSFKTTEDDLRTAFSPFGEITDVNMPKKDDGAFRGFAFIAFKNMGSSLKAIKDLNGKQICDRKVAVDFSVNKTAYDKAMEEKKKIAPPPPAAKDESKPAENGQENGEDNVKTDKKKKNKKKNKKKADKKVEDKVDKETRDKEEGDDDDEEDDDDRIDNDFDFDADDDEGQKKARKPRKPDAGLTEGRTLFVRNLDLDTTEESVKELFQQFGDLVYCKLVMNPYTEKSKGTAFILYKTKESADKCLAESSNYQSSAFYLDGQQLTVSLALERNRLYALEEEKRNKYKDKRNLYLAKEGLIYPKSPAAVGVSQPDLKKRVELEEKKRQQLQNLHYFISDKRLCVHNIPENYSDKKLQELFLAAADDKTAKITWAKVMKNRTNKATESGKKVTKFTGNSKGFGFVEFAEHWHALKALRFLNNNPDIWTPDRRPIVEFSVENKVAVNIKKWREIAVEKKKTDAKKATGSEPAGEQQAAQEGEQEGEKKKKNKGRRKSRNERIAGQKARKAAEAIVNGAAANASKSSTSGQDSVDQNNNESAEKKPQESEYSGVQSKPTTGKVMAPKMNRKMRTVKEDLLKNKRTLKMEKRRAENKKKHLVNLEKRKAKQEVANETAKKRYREEEDKGIDEHFHKRKRKFLDAQS